MRIKAFRGCHHGIGRERDVTKVGASPYDQISPEMQEHLYALSLDNIVRVSYPTDAPATGKTADKHERAHETLDRWPCYRGKKSAGTEKADYGGYLRGDRRQSVLVLPTLRGDAEVQGSCAELRTR